MPPVPSVEVWDTLSGTVPSSRRTRGGPSRTMSEGGTREDTSCNCTLHLFISECMDTMSSISSVLDRLPARSLRQRSSEVELPRGLRYSSSQDLVRPRHLRTSTCTRSSRSCGWRRDSSSGSGGGDRGLGFDHWRFGRRLWCGRFPYDAHRVSIKVTLGREEKKTRPYRS